MEIIFTPRHITPSIVGISPRDTLEKAIGYKDCGVIGLAINDIFLNHPEFNFVDIENILRKMKSNVYLIAAPTSRLLKNQVALYPITLKPAYYWLWISVNGEEEAKQTMKEFDSLNYTSNLEKLKVTGFINVKD